MPELREERSFGELLGQLSQDMTLLVRQEVQLAKTEINEKLSRAIRATVALLAGGVVAFVGALALVACVILLLHEEAGLQAWLAALLAGAVLGVIGFVMLQRALRSLKTIEPTPRRTVETVKETIQWAKEQP